MSKGRRAGAARYVRWATQAAFLLLFLALVLMASPRADEKAWPWLKAFFFIDPLLLRLVHDAPLTIHLRQQQSLKCHAFKVIKKRVMLQKSFGLVSNLCSIPRQGAMIKDFGF